MLYCDNKVQVKFNNHAKWLKEKSLCYSTGTIDALPLSMTPAGTRLRVDLTSVLALQRAFYGKAIFILSSRRAIGMVGESRYQV